MSNTMIIENNPAISIGERGPWADALKQQCGMRSSIDESVPRDATVRKWRAGELHLVDAQLPGHCLTPLVQSIPCEDQLLLKIVCSGVLTIEQHNEQRRFERGSVVLVDPSAVLREWFDGHARVVALHIPKQTLRERALRHELRGLHQADVGSADVRAVRSFVLFMTRHATRVSQPLLDALGEHCFALMPALLDDASGPAQRGAAATALRVRQVIAQHLGEPGLTVDRIAAELNISKSHLHRVLRSQGQSAMDYLWTLRLARAAQLLTQAAAGDSRTSEIAWQCGFTTAAHFCRAFKQRYGVSPKAYAAAEKARREQRE